MIDAAERDGRLAPGGTVVEATAGNTGLGLALVARAKGYRVVLVVPDKMSTEKVLHLKALGAEVHITRSDVGKGHPDYYQDFAARLAEEIPGAFFADQFNNPANPLAHESSTGPEIWQQCGHDVDAIVVGVGSGGTVTGLTRYFRELQPRALSSCSPIRPARWSPSTRAAARSARPGRGRSRASAKTSSRRSPTSRACSTPIRSPTRKASAPRASCCAPKASSPALRPARCSPRRCATAARRPKPQRVVTFVCDTGTRYLSKVYNDQWMIDQGLLARERYGDLRDLVSRRFEDGSVISVGPDDTLLTAFQRMRLADVSQLPVLDGGQLVGVIDESDLLLAVHADAGRFRSTVASAMTDVPRNPAAECQPGRARGRARPRPGRDRRRRGAASTA